MCTFSSKRNIADLEIKDDLLLVLFSYKSIHIILVCVYFSCICLITPPQRLAIFGFTIYLTLQYIPCCHCIEFDSITICTEKILLKPLLGLVIWAKKSNIICGSVLFFWFSTIRDQWKGN